MENGQLTWITNFIWSIADDVLRDIYKRGKYRDVILPITVIRRLDAVLEPTKQAVLDMKANLDKAGVTNQDVALRQTPVSAPIMDNHRGLPLHCHYHIAKNPLRSHLDAENPNPIGVHSQWNVFFVGTTYRSPLGRRRHDRHPLALLPSKDLGMP